MEKLIRRRGKAQIEARSLVQATDADLDLIARYIPEGFARPTAADVYVASALVCNDLVDHYSTRFTREALDQIVPLMLGADIMRNHVDYGAEALPIARIFDADQVEVRGQGAKDGCYDRMRFYWERGTQFGDEMAKKVGLALWREVSLSWWMRSFTNSIDGKPMKDSPYYAGQEMPDGTVVIGIMSDIVEVNEVSIVARGGQKHTQVNAVRADGRGDDVLELIASARARVTQVDEQSKGLGKFFKR